MTSDNQFTALGPTAIGFQTNGANIDLGAECIGVNGGVRAHGDKEFGISADSDEGPGVLAISHNGKTSAVYAVSKGPEAAAVHGQGLGRNAPGIVGESMTGRGGIFFSNLAGVAQVQLVPQVENLPPEEETRAYMYIGAEMSNYLPSIGRSGDLIMLTNGAGSTGLWLCVQDADGSEAQWRQLLLSEAISGSKVVDQSVPIDEPVGRPSDER